MESIWHAVRLVGGTTRTIAITDAAVRAAAASIWGEGMGGEDIAREALKAALPHLLGGNSTVTVDLKTQLVDAMIAMQTLYDTLINGPDITNHDARYIQLSNQPVDHTVSHGNRVLVDLHVDGMPVGIEIFGLDAT